jgi:hypothetical protein
MLVSDLKFNVKRMLHGASESSIGDFEMMMERAANTMLSKVDLLSTMRTVPLNNVVHDDIYNYALPSDFKKPIDLYPQDSRYAGDKAGRRFAESFDLSKALEEKQISIESSEGTKIMRINWKSRQGKVLHDMNSLTSNGTWGAVGSATGLEADTIFKVSGSASIKFDLVADDDGIQNTSMDAVDMTLEDEIADVFVSVYLPSVPTDVTAVWGNDLTTNYWTSTAQTTQADGTAFRVGWNILKFSWASATETGTVDPTLIGSFKITVGNATAISNIRIDNIIFSIGRNFDLKYYSKYLIKNSSGTWITRSTDDGDTIVLDNDEIQIYLLECLIATAQQLQTKSIAIDITFAKNELVELYEKYKEEHPSQTKKTRGRYYKLNF